MSLPVYRSQIDRMKAEYSLACKQIEAEQDEFEDAKQRVTDVQTAQGIVQGIASQVQASAHQQIAGIVSRCLETIFGEDAYEFKILFEEKRGRTEARLVFIRDGNELDPLGAAGGGVVDLASFALRLSCLLLSRPSKRKLLVLDEPMKHLSSDHTSKIRELLLALAKDTGVQIVMVTHQHGLRCGKVIELE